MTEIKEEPIFTKSTIKGNIGTLTFNEPINMTKFNYILNNFENYEERIIKNEVKSDKKTKYDYDPKTLMYRIRDNISNLPEYENTEIAVIKTTYKKGVNSNGFGRYFAKKNLSIQSLPRVVRHTISEGIWYDLDIINAQPTLLYNICKKYKIDCPILKNYVASRDEVFFAIQKEYKCNKEQAKNKIISVINGGKAGKYYNLKPFEEEIKRIYEILIIKEEYSKIHTTSIKSYVKKTNAINETLAKSDECNEVFEDIDKKTVKKEPNKIGAFMSLLLQDAENTCLEYTVEFLEISKYIVNNEVSFIFDGCQVRKDPTPIIKDIQKYILEKTGHFDLFFKVKAFDECLKLPDDYANTIDENMILVNLYNGRVAEFVKTYNTIILATIRNDGCHQFIAEICYKFFGEGIKYDTKAESWFYCDNFNIWKKDKKGLILSKLIPKCIPKIFLGIVDEYCYNKDGEYDIDRFKLINAIVLRCNNDGFIKSVINRCIALFATDEFYEKSLDSKGHLFAFKDKVYDFVTKSVRDIKPNDYIYTHTGYNYPKYIDEDAKDEIMEFFKSVYVTVEMVDYILNLIVLTMNGNRTIQQFNIFTGTGSNGKSLLIYILETILGNYVLKINPETITKPVERANATSELSGAKGKRLLYCNEPENGQNSKIQVGRIKELAGMGGRETIKTRGLYENPIEFVIHFMIFLLCNDKPSLSNADGGIGRRTKVINHLIKFVDNPSENNAFMKLKDETLFEKLGSDIYRNTFILMLLDRWETTTSKIKTFIEPEQVKKDSAEYIETSNEVLGYINEYFEVTQNNEDKYPAGELLTDFRRKTSSIISNDTFKVRMLEMSGISWKKTKTGAFYFGIKRLETNTYLEDN